MYFFSNQLIIHYKKPLGKANLKGKTCLHRELAIQDAGGSREEIKNTCVTLAAMGYSQREINTAMQGLKLGSANAESEETNNAAPEGTAEDYLRKEHHGNILDGIRQHLGDVESMESVSDITGNEFQKTADDPRPLRQKVIEFFNQLGNKVYRKGFGEIALNDAGARDSTGHGFGKLKAATFASLPAVLENGKMISYDPSFQGRPYASYLIAAPVTVGGERCYVGAYVIRDEKTQRYKVHEVLTINKDGTQSFKTETSQTGRDSATNVPSNSNVSSPAPVVNTNSSSGIIWAGSERAEGGMNHAETEQSQQGVLGQEEAQPAAGGNAGQTREADADAGRTAPGQPAGTRETGTSVSDGGGGRDAGARARGTAGQLDEQARRHQERRREQGQRAADRRRDGAALRERGEAQLVSARGLGVRAGTEEANLTLIPSQAWDEEMREVERTVWEKTGYGVMYVLGPIQIQSRSGRTANVRGVLADGVMILQADDARASVTQLADHESFHALARTDPELREAARQKILERFTPEELRRKLDSYITMMQDGLLAVEGDVNTQAELVMEELLADAYADINWYGLGAYEFGGAVRDAVQERAGMQQAQGVQETRGPPEERYSIDERFAAAAQKWYDETKPEQRATSPGYFHIGTISDALINIGARADNIYMRKYKIGTILEDHPNMSIDVIKQVPQLLENPVLIMKSRTQPDSIVLLGDLRATNNDTVLAALQLTPTPGGGTEAEFSLVTSAYDRSRTNIQNLIRNSELLYLDPNKNRTNNWLMQLRVQFPSRQPPFGSIGTISYDDDGVNIQGKTLKDLGVEMTVAPDLDSTQKTVSEIPDEQKTPMQKAMEDALKKRTDTSTETQPYSTDDSAYWESMPEDQELLRNAAARDDANPEVTAWGKKQERIETLDRKANNLREAMQENETKARREPGFRRDSGGKQSSARLIFSASPPQRR